MQVDDAFVWAVRRKTGRHEVDTDIIAATLAVAAERGLVVPEGAPRMWTVRDLGCPINIYDANFWSCKEVAEDYCDEGETVVRVAIVEIKE